MSYTREGKATAATAVRVETFDEELMAAALRLIERLREDGRAADARIVALLVRRGVAVGQF